MKLDLSPVTSHLRVFLDDKASAENKDPYDSIMTVQYLNDKHVYISGLKGVMNTKIFRSVVSFFKKKGIDQVKFEKRGKYKTIDANTCRLTEVL